MITVKKSAKACVHTIPFIPNNLPRQKSKGRIPALYVNLKYCLLTGFPVGGDKIDQGYYIAKQSGNGCSQDLSPIR